MDLRNILYNKGLLILGALNANVSDRKLDLDNVELVQFIFKNEIYYIKKFSEWFSEWAIWNDYGAASMCWDNKDQEILFTASERDLYKINLYKKSFKKLNIPDLDDIHEIEYRNKYIWIANTGRNEIVCYDPSIEEVINIVDLIPFKSDGKDYKNEAANDIEIKDVFHVNQAFFDYNDDLSVLTHHVNGYQVKIHNRFHKWIKQQGDGGIINISKKILQPLKLSSPHSVRLINNKYYVCDSAKCRVTIFDKNWRFLKSIPTDGYSRGMDHCLKKKVLFVGNSAIRKRYKHLFKGETSNSVEIFSLRDHKPLLKIDLEKLEQINNIYLLDENQSELLLSL